RTPSAARGDPDREDELQDGPADPGAPEPWTLAEAYATAGLDSAFVQEVADAAGSETPSTLRWIAASLSARHMASELAQSTKQMGKLVKAVKKFAYMDRGDVVSVDLAEAIEN